MQHSLCHSRLLIIPSCGGEFVVACACCHGIADDQDPEFESAILKHANGWADVSMTSAFIACWSPNPAPHYAWSRRSERGSGYAIHHRPEQAGQRKRLPR